jgi:hypothetical protein
MVTQESIDKAIKSVEDELKDNIRKYNNSPTRGVDEPFDMYKMRMQVEKKLLRNYLKGRLSHQSRVEGQRKGITYKNPLNKIGK